MNRARPRAAPTAHFMVGIEGLEGVEGLEGLEGLEGVEDVMPGSGLR